MQSVQIYKDQQFENGAVPPSAKKRPIYARLRNSGHNSRKDKELEAREEDVYALVGQLRCDSSRRSVPLVREEHLLELISSAE